MKYSSYLVVLVFSLVGVAHAASDDNEAVNDAESDERVACVEAAIAEEVDEKEQFDKFVEECIQEGLVKKQKSGQDKS